MGKLLIPELPTYETILPSTGKSVTFRPITVKEESFLLMAKESESKTDILHAVKETIRSCVDYPFKKMSFMDIEWLFLQIRIRSVSNEVELGYRCTNIRESGKECGAKFESVVDLEKVTIQGSPKVSIPLKFKSGEYIISLKQPGLDDVGGDEAKALFSMIESIVDPTGEVVSSEDISFEEFEKFIGTFTNKQMEELKAGIKQLGKLYFKDILKCPVCGSTNEVEYTSLIDFFG